MGWIVKSEPECEHELRPGLPGKVDRTNSHMLSDVWQCDDCGEKFMVGSYSSYEGMQHDPYEVQRFHWEDIK